MSKFKNLVLFLLVITLAACKTSPSQNTVEINPASDPPLVTANTEADVNPLQEVVTSTADTEASSSQGALEYNVDSGIFHLYPRESNGWDENGWSLLSPSEDTRLIYVSSSLGDDDTAEFYASRDVSDIQSPGLIKPFKTISAALNSAREGFPDWILLSKSDVWEVDEKIQLKRGRAKSERFVFTSYGDGKERPLIKSSASEAIRIWSNRNYTAVVGISFYAYKRDPESSEFMGWGNVPESTGLRIYSPEGTVMGTLLLEDNMFSFFSTGVSITGGGNLVDAVVRRNIIQNSYSEKNHSQGMYAGKSSILLEENIFYHNGWYKQQIGSGNEKGQGQATMFNHNTYFPKSEDTIFRKNIFISSSSIHNKWTADSKSDDGFDSVQAKNIVIDNNVYIGGEIGISAGGNTDYDTGYRWQNVTISNNIMSSIGQDQPTNRTLGWYISASDWDGGVICGNYLLHNNNTDVTNLKGIEVSGHSSNVSVKRNLIVGLMNESTAQNAAALLLTGDQFNNILVEDNLIQLENSKLRPIRANSLIGVNFKDNDYFSDAELDNWFRVDSENYDFSDWQLTSNEVGATNTAVEMITPERSLESYALSLGQNFEQLKRNFLAQSKSVWQQEYTVDAITSYIKDGYGEYSCD
jgi:hypothetical protein